MSGEDIQQLHDGRFVLAFWQPCAGEWYALPLDRKNPVSGGTLERLVEQGAQTYATRKEAQLAALLASR